MIDAETLVSLLSPAEAVEALERALLDGSAPGTTPARTSLRTSGGELLLMPAAGGRYAGVKLVSVAPGNFVHGLPRVQGVYVLFDAQTLTPLAMMDAAGLTTLRTPAVSALAVRHLLAPRSQQPDQRSDVGPARLLVLGTGPQAYAHVEAFTALFLFEDVTIAGRDRDRAQALAAWSAERCATAHALVGSAPFPELEAAVRAADVVLCATTSREPLIDDAWVADDAVVVAIGSHEPDARELPGALLHRATVVVESREAALREAGDVVLAAADLGTPAGGAGALIAGDLADLVRGNVPVPPGRPRVFTSVGEAWEDLAVAVAAYQASLDAG